jgi:hypothetical protein
MRFAWILLLAAFAGCSSIGGIGGIGGTVPSAKQFDAPMARVKPAFISTLSGMGMMITSLETRGGREVLKAKKGGSEVEVELEAVSGSATRARVGARSGGLLYDDDAANRILQLAEKRLNGT